MDSVATHRRISAGLGLLLWVIGLVALPTLHLAHHGHRHQHGPNAEALHFDPTPEVSEVGPHGGLLLHPAQKEHSPLSEQEALQHGKRSVEHFTAATALSAPTIALAEPPPLIAPVVQARIDAPVVRLYLLSPIEPNAPPA